MVFEISMPGSHSSATKAIRRDPNRTKRLCVETPAGLNYIDTAELKSRSDAGSYFNQLQGFLIIPEYKSLIALDYSYYTSKGYD